METKLTRIAQIAKEKPKEKITLKDSEFILLKSCKDSDQPMKQE